MLQFDLRELASGPVDIAAQLGAEDPLFEGLGVALTGPVRVRGRLQAAGAGRFYWKGSLHAQVGGECRRCLAPVPLTVTADIGAVFTEDPDAQEDPDSYPLAHDATQVDLRPAVREELLLRAAVGGVPGGLPRAVPALWQRPERGPLRLPAGPGSALAGARRSQGQASRLKRTIHGRTEAKDLQTEKACPPHALQGGAHHAPAVPPVWRPEAAAPRLSDLRLLPRRAAGGSRGLT